MGQEYWLITYEWNLAQSSSFVKSMVLYEGKLVEWLLNKKNNGKVTLINTQQISREDFNELKDKL